MLSLVIALQLFALSSCSTVKMTPSYELSTQVSPATLERLPSPFPELADLERQTEWGKELQLGQAFGKKGNFSSAIFCFQRAHILLSSQKHPSQLRSHQIEYDLLLSYAFARQFKEVLELFQTGSLAHGNLSPAIKTQILILLIEATKKAGRPERLPEQLSEQLNGLFEQLTQYDLEKSKKLRLWYQATSLGKITFDAPTSLVDGYNLYQKQKINRHTPQLLNALLPGSGYMLLGQYRTGVTALAINGLFIIGGVELIKHGLFAAGAITLGLEAGWYMGGIYGAGLATAHYNEQLWKNTMQPLLEREGAFPLLQLTYGF